RRSRQDRTRRWLEHEIRPCAEEHGVMRLRLIPERIGRNETHDRQKRGCPAGEDGVARDELSGSNCQRRGRREEEMEEPRSETTPFCGFAHFSAPGFRRSASHDAFLPGDGACR